MGMYESLREARDERIDNLASDRQPTRPVRYLAIKAAEINLLELRSCIWDECRSEVEMEIRMGSDARIADAQERLAAALALRHDDPEILAAWRRWERWYGRLLDNELV